MKYEPLDHTADIGFDLEAASLEELYTAAALAFVDAVTDIDAVEPRVSRRVQLAADDRELLMVEWLEELVFLLDAEALLFSRAAVHLDEGPAGVGLTATLRGERLDAGRHPHKVAVKGITYHGLEVRRDGERWYGRVIFDI